MIWFQNSYWHSEDSADIHHSSTDVRHAVSHVVNTTMGKSFYSHIALSLSKKSSLHCDDRNAVPISIVTLAITDWVFKNPPLYWEFYARYCLCGWSNPLNRKCQLPFNWQWDLRTNVLSTVTSDESGKTERLFSWFLTSTRPGCTWLLQPMHDTSYPMRKASPMYKTVLHYHSCIWKKSFDWLFTSVLSTSSLVSSAVEAT